MMDSGPINRLKEIVGQSENIVAFTGAGISVPSGIPDFRSAGGLYSAEYGERSAEYMLSDECLNYETEKFFKFYKEKMLYPDARPNEGHLWLADMESQGRLKAVITQNIDGLHTIAGSGNVIEFHGSVHRNYCVRCGRRYDADFIANSKGIPVCESCGGTVRPDVVLYGERIDEQVITDSVNAVRGADCMIVIGTSLVVYPAAGLIEYFRGQNLVLINKSRTGYDSRASLVINGDIREIALLMMK